MENPYSREPLQVTLYDVGSGEPVRSYMLVGAAPPSVLAAARRGGPVSKHPGRLPTRRMSGRPSAWPETAWSAGDEKILQRHYGTRWRQVLTPRIGAVVGFNSCKYTTALGGHDEDFGSLDDFDDADIILRESELDDSPSALTEITPLESTANANAKAIAKAIATETNWDSRTSYTPISVYPEDTFADLKLKIYTATGIPPYRQHVFYTYGDLKDGEKIGPSSDDLKNQPVRTLYRLTVERGVVLTDVRQLSQQLCERGVEAVAGLPIDRRLEEHKEDVRVDALDAFQLLEESPGVYVRRVFVADLAPLLRARDEMLQKAISDGYQFDLLYYGFILKYWPSLSPEAFRTVIVDPEAIGSVFPLLSPSPERVRQRLRAEQTIIDGVYSRSKEVNAALAAAKTRGGLSVTGALIEVVPRAAKTPLNVRNVFDWVMSSPEVPAIVARAHPDALGYQDVAVRGSRDYILEKTHVTASSVRVAPGLAHFLARPPKRSAVSFAIIRNEKGCSSDSRNLIWRRAVSAQPRFVFFTVFADGRYSIESSWCEDDRVGFDEVIQQLSTAARPIIEVINKMGAAALPLGGALEPPTRGGVKTKISSLTVSAFWPQALTTKGFSEMKERWRAYEKAGIVGIRGLQQAGAYAFFFRKGVVDYDPRALEKVVSRGALGEPGKVSAVTNHYAYLTDPMVAQKWSQVYSGRLVRVYHRTTDLRVEAVNVTGEEFERIHRYVFSFLYDLAHGPNRLAQGIVPLGMARPTEGRLKSLQELDPDLYDLKKFDEGATVYSVLCQGDRQPELVSEEVFRTLNPQQRSRLVEYWNFSRGQPSYYRCPSKKYPHLSFRTGEHPLGYCLPCCKKTTALPGSRAETLNRLCTQNQPLTGLDIDDSAASRHVLSYGKVIPAGRISHAPRLLAEGLFYDAAPKPAVFRLLGVPQQAVNLPAAGFLYALSASLEMEPSEFVRELARTTLALSDTYKSLAAGKAYVFASAHDLADALVKTFLPDPQYFSRFGPGGAAADSWREIVADLARIRFGVDVVEFVDSTGDGAVVFEATPTTIARIMSNGKEAIVAILVTMPTGTYPLIVMNQKTGARDPGQGLYRRLFSTNHSEGDAKDQVVKIIRDMVAETSHTTQKPFDLAFVHSLCEQEGYKFVYKLINLRDQCYGVVLELGQDGELVYFPIPYSPHRFHLPDSKGPPPTALYGPRPLGKYPAAALAKVLAAANNNTNNSALWVGLQPTGRLATASGDTVGFIAAVVDKNGAPASGVGAYFHHDPVSRAEVPNLPWGKTPETLVPYDMATVDRAIYASGGHPASNPLPPGKDDLAKKGLLRHRLYRLFLAEFAALLRSERNGPIRKRIITLFKRTRFGSPASLVAMRRELAHILREFPEDAEFIRRTVTATYSRVGPLKIREEWLSVFAATTFEFDRTTLIRLRLLPPDKIVPELERMLRPRMQFEEEATPPPASPATPPEPSPKGLMNMYVACSLPSSIDRPQCVRQKLRISKTAYLRYVSVLASDVLNPLKIATLGTMTAGIVDGAHFVTRPGERIRIR